MSIWIYLGIALATLLTLRTDSSLQMTVLSSFLFEEEFQQKYRLLLQVTYALVWPFTLAYIFYLSTQINKLMRTAIIAAVLIFLCITLVNVGGTAVTYYNESVGLELKLQQKLDERLVVLDRITKIIYQKLEVAKINDSSYYKNLNAITLMRKDGLALTWKWVQETNPNANYNEVSALYIGVSDAIQGERDNLFAVEQQCQQVVYQYTTLRRRWPSNIYLWYRPATLRYEPISTSANKVTNKTGVDNKISIE